MLAFPAAARADWFPAAPIDGPNADVVSVGNVDMARDGHGAIGYLRRDGGVPHAAVARMVGGDWRPPERLDAGLGEAPEGKGAVGGGGRGAAGGVAGGDVESGVGPGGGGGAGAV